MTLYLYNYEFGLSLCKIVRSSVILLLPLLSLDNIWLRSNDAFVHASCVRFVYRSLVSCIVRSFVCVFRIVRSFHFVRSFVYRAFVSCIVRLFRVSCVFRIVCVKRSFVFRSFRLRFLFVCVWCVL